MLNAVGTSLCDLRIVGAESEGDPTGANDGIGDDAEAPIAPANAPDGRGEDDSGTIPENPRRVLIDALASAVREGLRAATPALVKDRRARALVERAGVASAGVAEGRRASTPRKPGVRRGEGAGNRSRRSAVTSRYERARLAAKRACRRRRLVTKRDARLRNLLRRAPRLSPSSRITFASSPSSET